MQKHDAPYMPGSIDFWVEGEKRLLVLSVGDFVKFWSISQEMTCFGQITGIAGSSRLFINALGADGTLPIGQENIAHWHVEKVGSNDLLAKLNTLIRERHKHVCAAPSTPV